MVFFRLVLLSTVFFSSLLWLVSASANSGTAEKPPLAIELSAWRYSSDSKLALVADVAVPGETLKYQLRYTNQSQQKFSNVLATLPIPTDMVLVSPKTTLGLFARTDNTEFSPWPLREKVLTDDGREIDQLVPLEKIRQLRWSIPALSPGAVAAFSADVQVKN
jgi:uncharacterized repeat protein (TIGR01451 family)